MIDYYSAKHFVLTVPDHVLGRPDPKWRKYQIFSILLLWSIYIWRKPNGPKPASRISRWLREHLTPWQIIVIAYMSEYVRRNFARILGLEVPEPLAAMYNRDYFRATWITTALDAGFWTAMRIRSKPLKNLCNVIFSLYYLVCADQADEVVRKVRGKLSLAHMRVSWNKSQTAPLRWITPLMIPKKLRMRYKIRPRTIDRPKNSPYTEPIKAWLYFDGRTEDELKQHDKIILDIPGGGFVAMDPRCHDEKLSTWAMKTGFPVLSLDYKKAPEYPYPYALDECYDVYYRIHQTRGRCIGMSGEFTPKVLLSGDSAGGNLAAALTLKILQARNDISGHKKLELPVPEALVLVYPALDLNMTSWLDDEKSALIKDPARSKTNRGVVRRKTEDYHILTRTPVPSDDELDQSLRMTPVKKGRKPASESPGQSSSKQSARETVDSTTARTDFAETSTSLQRLKSRRIHTRLEMTSMISYFNDRILSPELLRGMVIMYVGEENRPDLATDFLLSPLRAPEELLREFPKVFMLTGERDPLCDDTAIFEGRLRLAHLHKFQTRKELGLIPERAKFDEKHHVEVEFIPGVSHGFLQFGTIYPEGFKFIELCSRWMKRAFVEATEARAREDAAGADPDYFALKLKPKKGLHRQQSDGAESSDNEDRPLEMASLSMTPAAPGKGKEPANAKNQRRSGRGAIKKPFDGRLSPVVTRNSNSLQKLASAEHLIERRMDGMSIGITGDDDERPRTPS